MRVSGKPAVLFSVLLLLTALAAAPASATDFAIFGSWWDTEELGETAGGGIKLETGQTFQLQFRASYYPDLTEDFGQLIDEDDDFFKFELEAIPLEAGIKLNLGGGSVRPFIGGGATYFLLDSNFGEIDDEVGYYLTAGLELGGGGGGVGFFAEALYRNVEGTLNFDPEDIEDIEDVEIEDEVAIDLSGLAVNAGIVFRF